MEIQKMKKIIYFLFLMTVNCFAQGNNFEIILKVSGDLNKDRYPDLVTVAQDMSAEKSYQINIYFNNKKNKYILFTTSYSAIDGQSNSDGSGFVGLEIVKGIILIKNNSSATGYETHKYRFQKNNFELIGYTSEYSDRQGTSYTSDLNLMTGFQIDTEENYETNQIIKKEKKFVEIYERPTLSNFKRSEEGYY